MLESGIEIKNPHFLATPQHSQALPPLHLGMVSTTYCNHSICGMWLCQKSVANTSVHFHSLLWEVGSGEMALL